MFTRVLRLLVVGAIAAAAVFPPWAQDNPAAGMREYRGTKTSNGHSFILRRPPPASPERSPDLPPRTIAVEIDVPQWIREVLTVAIVMAVATRAVARSPLNPSVRDELEFGGRTWVVAFLLALIVPLPLVGSLSFLPWWFLTEDSMWVGMILPWFVLSFFIYLLLGAAAYAIQVSARRRRPHASAPA